MSFASDTDFKWLFDCQIVRQIFEFTVAFSADDLLRIDAAFFHVN